MKDFQDRWNVSYMNAVKNFQDNCATVADVINVDDLPLKNSQGTRMCQLSRLQTQPRSFDHKRRGQKERQCCPDQSATSRCCPTKSWPEE